MCGCRNLQLIQSHVAAHATAHQQESFLPLSSRQSLFSCLSRVAKRSTPKPHGPLLFTPPKLHVSLPSSPKPRGRPSSPSERHGPLSFPPEPRGHPSFTPELRGPLSLWLPRLGLNPSAHLPLQPHFRLLLQPVTPASIPVFFQLYWAVIVSPGRCGPLHGMEPIISTLSRRPCNQGELLPSPILGGIWSHPPGSKHGHSYLTHP